MQTRFSKELDKVVDYAREEAMRTGYYAIETEHLLLGILRHSDNPACEALEAEGMDLDLLKNTLDASILREDSIPYNESDDIFLSRDAQNMLSLAIFEASRTGAQEAGAGELLLAIAHSEDNPCVRILTANGIDGTRLISRLSAARTSPACETCSEKDLNNALLFGLDRISNYIDNDIKTFS